MCVCVLWALLYEIGLVFFGGTEGVEAACRGWDMFFNYVLNRFRVRLYLAVYYASIAGGQHGERCSLHMFVHMTSHKIHAGLS